MIISILLKIGMTYFFQKNKYATPTMLSPDGEAVYGSMRDYYSIMSNGNFDITGYILNKDNNNDGKPDWIALSNTKNYYNLHSVNTFLSDAKSAAISQGLDVSTNSTTKLCVIYAGHMYRTLGGLHPRAVGGIEYIMSEKFAFGDPYNQERSDATFSGIGVHCHEFGHLLGFPDTYSNNSYSTAFWDLMGTGNYNSKAHAPAPLNPYFRIKKGWISCFASDGIGLLLSCIVN
ncbi:immune inhibitor A domain-containing protein [Calditrichota bacterium GD2]